MAELTPMSYALGVPLNHAERKESALYCAPLYATPALPITGEGPASYKNAPRLCPKASVSFSQMNLLPSVPDLPAPTLYL